MALNSCLYTGNVRHRRHQPILHELDYRLFMLFLDLDELPKVFSKNRFWSLDRFNIAAFHQKDYFSSLDRQQSINEDLSLKERVIDFVRVESGINVDGRVMLLTHGRYFGHTFNPVSFYYCYSADDELLAIVPDITNTPWDERHAYVLPVVDGQFDGEHTLTPSGRHSFHFDKSFHVSPFNPMAMRYDWHFAEPGEKLWVHMDVSMDNGRHFDATLQLEQKELSPAALNSMLIEFPLMTMKVVVGIYWNALRLWLKRSPFYDHPNSVADDASPSFEKK